MPFIPSRIAAILPIVRSAFAPAASAIGNTRADLPNSVLNGIPRETNYPVPGVALAGPPAALACLGQYLWPQTERSTATTLPSSSA